MRRGDYGDAASLREAFAGADRVLLVSAATHGAAAVRQHGTAVAAARAAGVGRVVHTSHMGADPASPFAPMTDHAATEELLRDSGLAYTALRNGSSAASAWTFLSRGLDTGELAVPQDGPVSWTAHADLAEAAAIALTDDGRLDGITPPLTAGEALDLSAVAALAAELTGRPLRRVVVGDAEQRADLVARGVPEDRADMLLGMFAAARQGAFAAVDPTLGELLGRPPVPVREVLATNPGMVPARD